MYNIRWNQREMYGKYTRAYQWNAFTQPEIQKIKKQKNKIHQLLISYEQKQQKTKFHNDFNSYMKIVAQNIIQHTYLKSINHMWNVSLPNF